MQIWFHSVLGEHQSGATHLGALRRLLSRGDTFSVGGLAELQQARVDVEATEFRRDGGWHKFVILQKKCGEKEKRL